MIFRGLRVDLRRVPRFRQLSRGDVLAEVGVSLSETRGTRCAALIPPPRQVWGEICLKSRNKNTSRTLVSPKTQNLKQYKKQLDFSDMRPAPNDSCD